MLKMTEQGEQWVASNFALSLNIPQQKLFGWFRRPQLWATDDWLFYHDNACPPMHHISCRVSWWNIKLPRWLSPSTARKGHPVTSGFSQNTNHLWKGKDFKPSMRFRKNMTGQLIRSWWLGELCEVPRCLLWRTLRSHCPMYNVPCTCIFFQ